MQTTQQAMDAGQARREAVPALWDDFDDELLNETSALDQARDELEATPAVVTQWLAEQCDESRNPLRAGELGYGLGLTVPQMVAVLFAGSDMPARIALHSLREAFRAAQEPAAKERAAELLEEQAKRLGL